MRWQAGSLSAVGEPLPGREETVGFLSPQLIVCVKCPDFHNDGVDGEYNPVLRIT